MKPTYQPIQELITQQALHENAVRKLNPPVFEHVPVSSPRTKVWMQAVEAERSGEIRPTWSSLLFAVGVVAFILALWYFQVDLETVFN